MKIKVRGIEINYEKYGKGKDIVLLHGWGQNIAMMMPLAQRIAGKYTITILDLPGFGLSNEPKESLSIYEYADLVEEIFKKLEINNPVIIGHSFGGRLGIILGGRKKCEKLILFGAPCIREYKPKPKEKLLKFLKKIKVAAPIVKIMKSKMGSADYNNATPVMRDILVKTVNQDLSDNAKNIDSPTLMIWGTNDTAAPIDLARRLEKLISDAALIEIPGASHYAYLEHIDYVSIIVNNFLGGNK